MLLTILAQNGESTSTTNSLYSIIMMVVLFGGLFYFLLIRPQRTRSKKHDEMMKALEVGDEIETIGGIYGTIEYFDEEDQTVILQIEDGTRIRLSKRALSGKVTRSTE